jgi:hypothetical protein
MHLPTVLLAPDVHPGEGAQYPVYVGAPDGHFLPGSSALTASPAPGA